MIGQVLVDGRPGWKCWACGSEWQIPPHNDAAEYADEEREWMQAHKGCDPAPAPQAVQLTMMEDPGNGAQATPDPGLPTVRG